MSLKLIVLTEIHRGHLLAWHTKRNPEESERHNSLSRELSL